MEIDLYRMPVLLAGIATVFLGGILLFRPLNLRGRHTLGAMLTLKGTALLIAGVVESAPQAAVEWLLRGQFHLLLPVTLLCAYVVVNTTLRRAATRSKTLVATIGAIVVVELVYLAFPSSLLSMAASRSGDGLARAGPGWVFTDYGPLVVLLALGNAALALLAVLFARQATRGEPKQRVVAYWFAVGFIVNGVFDGGMAIAYLIHDPAIGGVSGLGWILGISRSLALLPAGIALGILVGSELSKPVPQGWRWGMPAVLALAAWFSGPMPVIFGAADYGQTWPTAVATGLWRAALPVLMGVGLWQLRLAAPSPSPTPARPVVEDV